MSVFEPICETELSSSHSVSEMVNPVTGSPNNTSDSESERMEVEAGMKSLDQNGSDESDGLYGMNDWSNYGFRWIIDCYGFEREEIDVEITSIDGENLLTVSGERRDRNGTILRSIERQLGLPNGTEIDHIRAILLPDGVLIVETPYIEIDYQGGRQVVIERV